ncbi:uncharacterized protein LOC108911262 [Anoplophora glabripennis]|uniref:uncharacterized protein LOC108911262 n=1 Tax=Anoplophora glabripennis TaxID=217634 RepID=UPI000874676D|nr:uncharacterized protein LOC108911262 [Anoplophora glabripennis]
MQKIVLLLCFAILHTASALKCFYCKDPTTCGTDIETWYETACANSAQPTSYQPACLRLSYKDKTTQEMMVIRKCALVELKDGKPSYDCQSFGDEAECPLCQTDLCNSAKSISFSFVVLCGVVLAIAVPKLL